MSQTTHKPEWSNSNRCGFPLVFCEGTGNGRELTELMAGIAPDRCGDAFNMAKRQDDCGNVQEETRTNDTP